MDNKFYKNIKTFFIVFIIVAVISIIVMASIDYGTSANSSNSSYDYVAKHNPSSLYDANDIYTNREYSIKFEYAGDKAVLEYSPSISNYYTVKTKGKNFNLKIYRNNISSVGELDSFNIASSPFSKSEYLNSGNTYYFVIVANKSNSSITFKLA